MHPTRKVLHTALCAGTALAVTLGPVALAGPALAAPAPTAVGAVAAASGPLLRIGSRGQAVLTWQRNIDVFRTQFSSPAAGRIATDGSYGPNTAAATRDFQRYYRGVAVDGVVGPNTRARMQQTLAGANAGASGSGTANAGGQHAPRRLGDGIGRPVLG